MDTTCLHCDATLSRGEMTDGWCDTCGKKLPSRLAGKSNRETKEQPAASSSGNAISAGTVILVVIMGIALMYFLVTALLGDPGSAAFFVKLGLRVAVFAMVAIPIALIRAVAVR